MATITTPMMAPHVGRSWWRQGLLSCGIIASVWWVAMDVVGSLRYPGYSYIDQTISELGAEGAPTRAFMTVLSGIPYFVLMIAFGIGIWITAGGRRTQRITAALLIGEVVWGFVGGLAFPMATREVIAAGQDTLRNQMHAWYGIGMPIFFVLAIAFGSRLFGTRFWYFSYATILVMLVGGLLVGLQTSALTVNQPTPWLGVEERMNAYASLLWFAVLAIGLLRARGATAPKPLDNPTETPQPQAP
ncbi:MAG TPA: DUF998 domain-containing protein [Herpetosiphonaceae bacterium]